MARGVAIVLLGETISVVGETFDLFIKLFGDRPSILHLLPTESTRKYAELSKLAFEKKFGAEPPRIKISTAPVEDIVSSDDLVKFFCHVSNIIRSYARELVEIRERTSPIILTITGGRKSMSVAAYVAASSMGVRVFDVRSSTWEQDKALNALLKRKLSEAGPEEVLEEAREYVETALFREADVYYELPRIFVDEKRADGRLVECLQKWY